MKAAARIIARILRPRRAAWPDKALVMPAPWAESVTWLPGGDR
jgi:hypothetical protein